MIFISNTQTPDGQPRPRRRIGCLGGCLIFFAVYFLCSAIIGWIMGDMFSTSSVTLEDKTVYRLQLKGTLVEQAQEENPFASVLSSVPYSNYTNTDNVGLDDILSNIRLAKNDDKILGIWLDGGRLAMTPAGAKAIRDALLDFKTSGKWILASSKKSSSSVHGCEHSRMRAGPFPTNAWLWPRSTSFVSPGFIMNVLPS